MGGLLANVNLDIVTNRRKYESGLKDEANNLFQGKHNKNFSILKRFDMLTSYVINQDILLITELFATE